MEKKKPIILSVIALLALVALVVGATFAYFQAQVGEGKSADIVVKSYTVDTFTFATGSQLSLNLDQDNFASGKGNITGSTYASATLTANNKTNTATMYYNLYLSIYQNNFEYTLNEAKPEIILTITDDDGNVIRNIENLSFKTVVDAQGNSIAGFDVTKLKGIITIFNKKEITASSQKKDKWNFNITFVNYDEDQSANAGKNFGAKIIISKDEYNPTLADYCDEGENLSNCIVKFGNLGYDTSKIYIHDENLANGAGDNSYRYAGANPNNYVCFGSNITPCPTDNLYRIICVFGDKVKLIKSDYATSALLGTDGDYQQAYTATVYSSSSYKGNNLANVAAYTWNYKNNTTINSGNGSNTWSTSLLNQTNLNQNFITNIGADWAAKIAETTWKVGGNTWANIGTQPAKTAYQNEIVSPVTTNTTDNATDYSAKVGLMYASDYVFAASPSAWTTNLVDYNGEAIINVNWMYMGLYEWTISRNADRAYRVFQVSPTDDIGLYNASYAFPVRPVFYLSSSVNYASGSGSATDPISIN